MTKLRILWLTENYPPRKGGMAQACDRIVSNLRRSNLTIDVCWLSRRARKIKTTTQNGGDLIVAPIGQSIPHSLNLLYNLISQRSKSASYTHIVAFGGNTPVIALPVFNAWLKTSAITMFRGNDFDQGIFAPQKRNIIADALKCSEHVCVLSNELKQKILALHPGTSIKVVPNGIDTTEWNIESHDVKAANEWKQQNHAPGKLNIGVAGHIKEKKGIRFLLEAVLKKRLEDRFRFIFTGDIESKLEKWINKRANKIDVISIPFMDRFQLLKWFAIFDYVALPSHYDGMPNVLLEAAALKVPIIALNIGGIKEVIPTSQNILTFSPGNTDECCKALYIASTIDARQREKIANDLYCTVKNNFTAQLETERYTKIFKSKKFVS